MNEELYEILLKLPRENLINLMWEALDEMQSSNTRTRTTCIMFALGAERKDIGWKMPSQRAMKENTCVMNEDDRTPLWWAYLHTNGTIHVKRYFDPLDLQEAAESPFVVRHTQPFNAYSRQHAFDDAQRILKP